MLSYSTLDSCRYVKGPWTDCDAKTNTRSRSLTLKKGDATACVQTRTIQKKCKKGEDNLKAMPYMWYANGKSKQFHTPNVMKISN